MWANKCCTDGNIKGSLLREAPTTEDANYPPGFIGWLEDGEVYFHIGSGQWISLSGGGGGGGGVSSLNGLTGALEITADPPLKVTPSGKNLKLTFEGTSAAIQKIITDNGTAEPNEAGEIELHGVAAQGTSTSAA